jgi:hypothetical protein
MKIHVGHVRWRKTYDQKGHSTCGIILPPLSLISFAFPRQRRESCTLPELGPTQLAMVAAKTTSLHRVGGKDNASGHNGSVYDEE